ncbi:hypothetical protein IQ260_03085 [Leptolyngbya cf. ectocarpi LEGE 11479]|uniref:Uncharacterized protein n=1 Tax=Leptolyngbya cf. ectocarpi LEGE 11479 TaxID=1828722 RepID=A0A928X0K0_LEPEC|nr:DUF6492 family protein [Leptolyngbya ectocarpi]MBE9065631.1 hypothetical protein [Leptolyngbya cf. ectocarpi LEGE 11479]
MAHESFDIVIPLFRTRWNTRAVLEGLSVHYQPRSIHIITLPDEAASLQAIAQTWQTVPLHIHNEELFFQGLTKTSICAELNLGKSLYNPGWFYQQLLKLGAFEGIANLSEWYLVWDSDLLPAETWPVCRTQGETLEHVFALLQHNAYGNPKIVGKWATWIQSVLGITPLTDETGTFIPHHMWFKQEHLKSFAQQIATYYTSTDHWLLLMMRSANDFGTFSEYWAYVSWVASKAPTDISFYPYAKYGETTERFFDDGTGLFSTALRKTLAVNSVGPDDGFSPSYQEVIAFIQTEYGADALPSSLAFESSPRHLKKNSENMHIEEQRSRWNPRMAGEPAVV